ncbi:MAG: hypothetical protein M0Q91_10865 [Methanoregula sp.]|jgi:hypothetical protein|nr:hypothetical protein [Methanoregula sp.]
MQNIQEEHVVPPPILSATRGLAGSRVMGQPGAGGSGLFGRVPGGRLTGRGADGQVITNRRL